MLAKLSYISLAYTCFTWDLGSKSKRLLRGVFPGWVSPVDSTDVPTWRMGRRCCLQRAVEQVSLSSPLILHSSWCLHVLLLPIVTSTRVERRAHRRHKAPGPHHSLIVFRPVLLLLWKLTKLSILLCLLALITRLVMTHRSFPLLFTVVQCQWLEKNYCYARTLFNTFQMFYSFNTFLK